MTRAEPAPSPNPLRRIVLIGMMGAGKSTIGARLAGSLGWRFLDLDLEIESHEGRSIGQIFEVEGESAFRGYEAAATRDVAPLSDIVIATGGGWIANPGLIEVLRPGALLVWLRVTPETALDRARKSPIFRPLLNTPDPLVTIRGLMRSREPRYAMADMAIDTEGRSVESIISEIKARVRAGNPAAGGC